MSRLNVPTIGFCPLVSSEDSFALLLAFIQSLRQESVSPSVVLLGSDLSRSALIRRLTGRYCFTMDYTELGAEEISRTLYQASLGSDLVVIASSEGFLPELGSLHLPDHPLRGLSEQMNFAVLTCAFASDLGPSLLSTHLGLPRLYPGLKILSPVLAVYEEDAVEPDEELDEDGDLQFPSTVLEEFERVFSIKPTAFGVFPESLSRVSLPESGINEESSRLSLARDFYVDLSRVFYGSFESSKLLKSAEQCETTLPHEFDPPSVRRARIAITDDPCFQLVYQSNCELLRHFGAELAAFSPLADSKLPRDIGAIYLTGGFLKEYASSIEINEELPGVIREFIDGGGVVFSEGAGTALLAKEVIFESDEDYEEDVSFQGIGILDSVVRFKRKDGPKAVEIEFLEESILGPGGEFVRGISTGSWEPSDLENVLKLSRVSVVGKSSAFEGFSPTAQSYCSFYFHNFLTNPEVAKSLVDSAEVFQRSRSGVASTEDSETLEDESEL